ncbi:MAG TPA: hypothetical protein VGV64_02060, partial [Thermoplasmata archaeon]|nr:hypothetical protein [Thermoplasmata archaeon]
MSLLLVGLALGSLAGIGFLHVGGTTAAPLGAPAGAALPKAAAGSVNGDLTVPSGSNVTLGPVAGHLTYYEGGNITVLAGGHLTLRNTTLVFVEFIGNNGSLS